MAERSFSVLESEEIWDSFTWLVYIDVMKKWLKIGVGVVILLIVALVVASNIFLTKNYLVAEIESSIDSRIQIGDLEVNLLSSPATVTISNVIIAERDVYAQDEVPHDERPKIEDGEIKVKEISFDVSLGELISKKINVSKLEVTGAHTKVVMNEEGELNIEKLFAEPPKEKKERERREKEKSFNAKENEDFVTELKQLIVKDTSFTMVIEKTGLVIEGSDLNVDLSDIRVDPNSLEQVNEAKLQFAAKMEVFSNEDERVKFGQIALQGPARVKLFDPATGDLEPDADVDFKIDDSSYVSTKVPYVKEVWKVTDTLGKLGLKVKVLPEQLTFGRSKKIKASYLKGKVDLHEPVSLVMSDWELALDGGSWFESGTEQHSFGVLLMAGESESAFVSKHLSTITDLVPKELRAKLHEEILEKVFVEGRLTLQVKTHGALSKPKVKLITRLPDTEKMAKEYAKKKLLNFALDKLLGDDKED
ncbi:hypothetical protein SAMN02745181_1476 [Rubritalea squalenifaciens DSM 18772]|uniref:AsmA domain-containing protein n=2 Tax=Rubritalea squalenifaciens TaxID=407226 RepID=A0A1M6HHX3_9BACT|nr:hypothetical protein SAMN02745181_1476 [Rubritalea squalenifaciens DSM 18772]